MSPTIAANPQSRVKTPAQAGRQTQAERREAARERILMAALKCFNQNGYHATSMADIADEAGVSKGLLHYHFNNKESLALAVEDKLAAMMFERITQTARPLEPSVKQALWALEELWTDVIASKQFVPITIDLAARALADDEKKQHFAQMINAHGELLKLGVKNILGPVSENAQLDEQVLADMLLVMLGGMAIGNVLLDDQDRFRRVFDVFKRMIIQYVLPEFQQEAGNGS